MEAIDRLLRRSFFVGGIVAVLYVSVLIFLVYHQAGRDEARRADAIIVLGAAQYNGRPSSVLRARLDHALALYEQGFAPLIVTTGGYGRDPHYSEAGVARSYLMRRGVPGEAILMEEAGTNSWQSLRGAAAVLRGHDARRVLLVSDPFHIRRIKLMATALGLEPFGSPTRTSPISRRPGVEFSYVLREVISLTVFRVGTALAGTRTPAAPQV